MGTKAVFAIGFTDDNGVKKYGTTIIGMTFDGFPENLRYLAEVARSTKKKLGIDKINKNNYLQVLEKTVEHVNKFTKDWTFLDKSKNAEWVSYSAIADLDDSRIEIMDGFLDEEVIHDEEIHSVLIGD